MKRNYYLVMETLRPFLQMQTKPLIEDIFSDSDVLDHIQDKFNMYRNRFENETNPMIFFDFYLTLDSENQWMFDRWFNEQMDKTEAKTIPHNTQ